VGREVLATSQEQLVERQVAARVDDGAGAVVHDQELVGLHSLPILLDEVGEHQAGVVFVAEKFNGHGGLRRCN
jgi:hypothetical protein